MTILVTPTRGPFLPIRPAPILFWSAVLTKVLTTLAAVHGGFTVRIGWRWAQFAADLGARIDLAFPE